MRVTLQSDKHTAQCILYNVFVYNHIKNSLCCRLPFVEQIFYDNSHKPRSISHKCIKTLDNLVELGESVTDKQLQEAKNDVKPEFVLQNLQTSVNS